MPPCSRKSLLKPFIFSVIVIGILAGFANFSEVYAGEPEYFNPKPAKPFVFAIGVGYGISNNPVLNDEGEKTLQGITLSGSLGYRLGQRFLIDFGPVVWIKGADLFQSDLPSGERTTNKTMLVSFNGYYQLHKKVPLSLKLGAGIGSIVHSPDRSTVSADGKKNSPNEYYSGFAGTASLVYSLKLTNKMTIHPSLNFWYTNLEKQQIDYVSAIDSNMPSITSDFRILMHICF